MSQKRFNIYLIVLSLILAGAIAGFQALQTKIILSNLIWISLAYFVILTYVTYRISYSALPKNNKTFITRIYGAIGIRFIFSLAPLLIYLIFANEKQLSFAIAYLLLYFFYTAFEIYFLVVNLRPDLNKQDRS